MAQGQSTRSEDDSSPPLAHHLASSAFQASKVVPPGVELLPPHHLLFEEPVLALPQALWSQLKGFIPLCPHQLETAHLWDR